MYVAKGSGYLLGSPWSNQALHDEGWEIYIMRLLNSIFSYLIVLEEKPVL